MKESRKDFTKEVMSVSMKEKKEGWGERNKNRERKRDKLDG